MLKIKTSLSKWISLSKEASLYLVTWEFTWVCWNRSGWQGSKVWGDEYSWVLWCNKGRGGPSVKIPYRCINLSLVSVEHMTDFYMPRMVLFFLSRMSVSIYWPSPLTWHLHSWDTWFINSSSHLLTWPSVTISHPGPHVTLWVWWHLWQQDLSVYSSFWSVLTL